MEFGRRSLDYFVGGQFAYWPFGQNSGVRSAARSSPSGVEFVTLFE